MWPCQTKKKKTHADTRRIDHRVGVWEADDPRGEAAQTPEGAGENAERAGQGAREAREPGEEAGGRHQEERKERADSGMQDPSKGPCPDTTVWPYDCLGNVLER